MTHVLYLILLGVLLLGVVWFVLDTIMDATTRLLSPRCKHPVVLTHTDQDGLTVQVCTACGECVGASQSNSTFSDPTIPEDRQLKLVRGGRHE